MLVLTICALANWAHAATNWQVDSLTDTPLAGQTTLRQAIAAASNGDTIEFNPSLFADGQPKTLSLSTALVVSKSLTIIGPDDVPGTPTPRLRLQGAGTDRILRISAPATVVAAGFAFKGGVAPGGGAVLVEAGASATFLDCDFLGNLSTGANAGGAIQNAGTLTLDQCWLAQNKAANGGAISSSGKLQVVRSLIQGNTASASGGGIYSVGADLWVESSTVAGNIAGSGGGISFFSGGGKAVNTATITAATVADNTASSGAGGLDVEGSGAIANVGGSIFARNTVGSQTIHDLDCGKSGKINSTGYNILVKPGTTFSPNASTDKIGTDPLLSALDYYGGRTKTYAIGTGSPAYNAGSTTFTGSLTNTDQRGSPRVWPVPPGGRVDIGAFEFAAYLTCSPTVTVEATAATTPVPLTATLTLPGGGPAKIVWTIGGVALPVTTMTVPPSGAPQSLTYTGNFALGPTAVTVTVASGALNLSCAMTVTVRDTTPPTIAPQPNLTVEATSPAGAIATFNPTATDKVSNPVVTTLPVSGSAFALGTTTVAITAKDAAGNTASSSFTVTVRDSTAPVLGALPNLTAEATSPTGAVVFFTPTATDALGAPVITTTPLSGSKFALGTTTVNVTAKDAAGNTATGSFTVTIGDTTKPMIAPQADLNVEATGPAGATVIFAPTATDLVSTPVVTTAPVSGSIFPLGTTTVLITAKDAAGNAATASFKVTVSDSTAPVLAAQPNLTVEATGPSGAIVTYLPTATDAVSAPVVTALPASGSVFPLGTTTVSLTARDAAGNTSTGGFTVTVQDTTPPAIAPRSTVTVEATSPAGAVALFSPTATDAVSTPVVTTLPPSGSTFALGVTPVLITAKDAAGNTATSSFAVKVQDTTPPSLTVPDNITVEATSAAGAKVSFTTGATDLVSTPTVTASSPSGTTFPLGATPVLVTATDAAGNPAQKTFVVTVRDTTPPVITAPANIVAEATSAAGATVMFGANAGDLVDGGVAVVASPASGTVFPLGMTVVGLTATDAANNTSTASFSVTVRDTTPPVLTVPANLTVNANLPTGAVVNFIPTASDAVGVQSITSLPASGSVFGPGTTPVQVTAKDAAGNTASGAFTVTVLDPLGITANNVAWPLAIDLDSRLALSNGKATGLIKQALSRAGESRWYKFKGLPGSRIDVTLTSLPANFDLVVYGDVRKVYGDLLGLTAASSSDTDKKLALLGAEFAPEAYSPEAYSPEAYSPEAYSPEAYSPEAYSPEAYSPEVYSPEAYAPEAYSPEAYSPEAYSPEAYSPEAYSPEVYSPEAYASAQQRSLIGFSASPGTVGEGVRLNTYSSSGEFYIRVRGQNGVFSLDAPFTMTVAIQQYLGTNLTELSTTPASGVPAISGSPTSLLVWDSTRMPGTAAEKSALATALAQFAAAANGVVADVAGDSQIAKLNAQADANPDLPMAKNLVADTIRNLIQNYRQAAPSLADITLVGSDSVIPFFRSEDHALLASEANYFPPVKDATQSQSSLRFAQVLSQDRYGSSRQVVLSTGAYDLPELPVGRVVETAAEATAYLGKYAALFNGTATSGSLPAPKTGFVAGYDFLSDAASALKVDFAAGLGAGGVVDSLISPMNQAPALGWTADQLRTSFLGTRHDLAFLGGHFSTARALAADFSTRIRTQEMVDAPVDLSYSLVLSAGCHSGYSTVDADAVPLVTDQPDWAQAFSRKGALWISGTGFQYGDTDFIEYTERLLVDVSQALRTGSGPVPVGRALVQAKRRYLADTAIMRGIHEKTLLEMVLYGLPMVKINLPGTRLTPPSSVTDIAGAPPVPAGPGLSHGLRSGDLSFVPTLTRVDQSFSLVGFTGTVQASYFTGPDGAVTIPGEPIRPRQSFNVSRPGDGFVRGIGFRSGQYLDLPGFLPFTGAPATETRGVHGSFSTAVFFPVRPWNLNQTGEVAGPAGFSQLNVFATQFISDSADAATGTLRKYGQMQFSVFYSPDTSSAALANPPAINTVSSVVGADAVAFSVDAAAPASAGVQEVWITYTGLLGSPFYGRWQSLSLTAPAALTGIGTWTGSLPLPAGADAALVRFMVQAVNGVGGVTQSTNFGRFFQPGTSTLDGIGGAPTAVSFVGTVPAGGTYRSMLPLQAKLVDGAGQPVPAKQIKFRLGPVIVFAPTDANGVATASLRLNARPDAYALEVSFAGDAAYQNSVATLPFTVAKAPTVMTLSLPAFLPDASQVVVGLRAADGTPLTQRSVVFILDNGTAKSAAVEITDGAGQAHLTMALTPANYRVSVYFGTSVTLSDGSVVALRDELYEGASTTGSAAIGRTLAFSKDQAWVYYADRTAPGATAGNQGASSVEMSGIMTSSDSAFRPTSITVAPKSAGVSAQVALRLSGKSVATGIVKLQTVRCDDDVHWYGTATLANGATVKLDVEWDSQRLPGRYHVWITPAPGSGPLYNVTPALLDLELTLGVGAGEHPTGGMAEIGGSVEPWSKQTGTSRIRTVK